MAADRTTPVQLISLGCACKPAHHIRARNKWARAYPFDWWITPLTGAVAFLADPDVDRLYDPRELEPIVNEGRRVSVRNVHYDIRLHHEFPRVDGEVMADFADHTAGPKARTAALLERLYEAATKPAVFIRNEGDIDPFTADAWQPAIATIGETLTRTFGFQSPRFMLVNAPPADYGPHVLRHTFDDSGPDWTGNAAGWEDALDRAVASGRG